MIDSQTNVTVNEMLLLLRSYGVEEAEIEAALNKNKVLPILTITKDYRILLGSERKEVRMEPLVKAVYLLFLNHPEGIPFKYLPDYRSELTIIYNKVRPWGMSSRAMQSIEDVTNPLLNSINEKCARIRKAFINQMDIPVAEHYYIKGARGSAKKISLSSDLIIRE